MEGDGSYFVFLTSVKHRTRSSINDINNNHDGVDEAAAPFFEPIFSGLSCESSGGWLGVIAWA